MGWKDADEETLEKYNMPELELRRDEMRQNRREWRKRLYRLTKYYLQLQAEARHT